MHRSKCIKDHDWFLVNIVKSHNKKGLIITEKDYKCSKCPYIKNEKIEYIHEYKVFHPWVCGGMFYAGYYILRSYFYPIQELNLSMMDVVLGFILLSPTIYFLLKKVYQFFKEVKEIL